MTTMRVVGECFFWYLLTRVFLDKFHRAVKRLCCVVCVFDQVGNSSAGSSVPGLSQAQQQFQNVLNKQMEQVRCRKVE